MPFRVYSMADASSKCHPGRMPGQAGTGLPAADGPAAVDPPWQDEPTVRAALREYWGLGTGPASQPEHPSARAPETCACGWRRAGRGRCWPSWAAVFIEGYRHGSNLAAEEAAAVALFQRLRIASRACYVTAPGALARVQSWMQRAFNE